MEVWLSIVVGLLGFFVILLGIFAVVPLLSYVMMLYRLFRADDPFKNRRD